MFTRCITTCRRLSFEQLLRKLLAMPGRPAVVLLHWWSPYINRHAFYASAEDGINTIAAYYGAFCGRSVINSALRCESRLPVEGSNHVLSQPCPAQAGLNEDGGC